ncbi:hypothetical protein [Rhizobium sp. Root483D2]|uniref:hypothetical protein n=1 Tax=Rhizobium sp. Root483D2 TaxID=1736545 RepID=UPI000A524E84|nr:hypothetical protein [Rhizobium sp. Root483D2]
MNFNAWGPFEFSGTDGQWKAEFWQQAADQEIHYNCPPDRLRNAIGCYMFAIKRGKQYTPWYVGQTRAAAGFEGEIFERHKLDHYRSSLASAQRSTGYIFLFPLITGGDDWRFSTARTTGKNLIDWLEKMLIGMALSKNTELRNLRDTLFLKNVWVEGVFGDQNPGRPSFPASEARKALL